MRDVGNISRTYSKGMFQYLSVFLSTGVGEILFFTIFEGENSFLF